MTNAATHIRRLNIVDMRRAAMKVMARKRRLPRPPVLLYPEAAERTYVRALREMLAEMHGVVVRHLVPALPGLVRVATAQRPAVTTDADDGDPLKRLLDLVRSQITSLQGVRRSEDLAKRIAVAVASANAGQIDKAFKDVLGVDLFRSEPWLAQEMKLFVDSQVPLIEAAGQRYFDEVSAAVYDGARQGQTAAEIADTLGERFAVAERKAKFIARNQVAQFNGQLTQLRQTQAGVSRYVWRTSRDERVRGKPGGLYPNARPSHWASEGKVYSWDDPPEQGHPGQSPNCRCWSEPVMEDLVP